MAGELPKTAFVLAGGGSLGAVQVGMLLALTEAGLRPGFVIGSSVGALNAAHSAVPLKPMLTVSNRAGSNTSIPRKNSCVRHGRSSNQKFFGVFRTVASSRLDPDRTETISHDP